MSALFSLTSIVEIELVNDLPYCFVPDNISNAVDIAGTFNMNIPQTV